LGLSYRDFHIYLELLYGDFHIYLGLSYLDFLNILVVEDLRSPALYMTHFNGLHVTIFDSFCDLV
jgi:hypothetical protein